MMTAVTVSADQPIRNNTIVDEMIIDDLSVDENDLDDLVVTPTSMEEVDNNLNDAIIVNSENPEDTIGFMDDSTESSEQTLELYGVISGFCIIGVLLVIYKKRK